MSKPKRTPIDQDSSPEQKWAAVEFILSPENEMENYGYDQKDWRRICRQRKMAVEALKQKCPSIEHVDQLHWECAGHRLLWTGERAWYCLGQSQNEEITNLAWRLANGDGADWLS